MSIWPISRASVAILSSRCHNYVAIAHTAMEVASTVASFCGGRAAKHSEETPTCSSRYSAPQAAFHLEPCTPA